MDLRILRLRKATYSPRACGIRRVPALKAGDVADSGRLEIGGTRVLPQQGPIKPQVVNASGFGGSVRHRPKTNDRRGQDVARQIELMA